MRLASVPARRRALPRRAASAPHFRASLSAAAGRLRRGRPPVRDRPRRHEGEPPTGTSAPSRGSGPRSRSRTAAPTSWCPASRASCSRRTPGGADAVSDREVDPFEDEPEYSIPGADQHTVALRALADRVRRPRSARLQRRRPGAGVLADAATAHLPDRRAARLGPRAQAALSRLRSAMHRVTGCSSCCPGCSPTVEAAAGVRIARGPTARGAHGEGQDHGSRSSPLTRREPRRASWRAIVGPRWVRLPPGGARDVSRPTGSRPTQSTPAHCRPSRDRATR